MLDGGSDAALFQTMILLTFCAFREIAPPCSAVIDSRYNAGNAEVHLGREPTGTLALLSALRSVGIGFRRVGHFYAIPFQTGTPAAHSVMVGEPLSEG